MKKYKHVCQTVKPVKKLVFEYYECLRVYIANKLQPVYQHSNYFGEILPKTNFIMLWNCIPLIFHSQYTFFHPDYTNKAITFQKNRKQKRNFAKDIATAETLDFGYVCKQKKGIKLKNDMCLCCEKKVSVKECGICL